MQARQRDTTSSERIGITFANSMLARAVPDFAQNDAGSAHAALISASLPILKAALGPWTIQALLAKTYVSRGSAVAFDRRMRCNIDTFRRDRVCWPGPAQRRGKENTTSPHRMPSWYNYRRK